MQLFFSFSSIWHACVVKGWEGGKRLWLLCDGLSTYATGLKAITFDGTKIMSMQRTITFPCLEDEIDLTKKTINYLLCFAYIQLRIKKTQNI